MNRRTFLGGAAALMACSAARADDDALASYRAWQEKRDRSLRDPNGWLSLAGLFWLSEGASTFGSGKACTFVFPRGPALAGTFHLSRAGALTVDAAEGVTLTFDGQPIGHAVIDTQAEEGAHRFTLGSLTWYVITRDGQLAIRLKDSQSPVLAAFKGVTRFPVSASWQIPATFSKTATPAQRRIATAQGTVHDEACIGILTFEAHGKTHRLEVYGEEEGDTISLMFGDLTNGHETYGGGRYVEVPRPDAQGRTVIDFNRAYNPPCAFTPYATCGRPPRENRLKLRVEAGEKTPH